MTATPSADRVEQVAFGFMASKVLFSAIEFGLFTELAKEPLEIEEIQRRLGLHPRSARDFFDTLVAIGLLERDGQIYSNTAETDFYLDRAKPTYIGMFFELWNARQYPMFSALGEGLVTGKPQNEIKHGEEDWIDAMYANPERLRVFLRGMTGQSLPSAMAIARKFDWARYKTFADIGPAEGCLPVQVAPANSHLSGEGFDLPAVGPLFKEYVASFGLQNRIRFSAGNFFSDPLPSAEVLVMGLILHDWNVETKLLLLKKVNEVLPKGGALIVYEHLIDDERRQNIAGLLMSLIMLLETQGGFDYTGGTAAAGCAKRASGKHMSNSDRRRVDGRRNQVKVRAVFVPETQMSREPAIRPVRGNELAAVLQMCKPPRLLLQVSATQLKD